MKAVLHAPASADVEARSARRHPEGIDIKPIPAPHTRRHAPAHDPDEDDIVLDEIEEVLDEFAISRLADEADFAVLVLFLERGKEIGVLDLEAMCCDDVSRLTLELLYELEDEETVIDSIAAFTEWIASRGDREDADEMIDAMFDIDSCELATVHHIGSS